MRLLGISGSLRAGSYNSMLLAEAAELLPDGVELVVFDGLRDVPPYDEDVDTDEAHPAVEALRAAVADADGILIATPEYNGSVPGQLKNALDWVSRPLAHNPLRNKPSAVISTSTGMFGAVWASAELRKVLGLIGARVLDRDTPVGMAKTAFTPDGRLDRSGGDETVEALRATVHELVDMVHEREQLRAAA